MNRGHLGHFLGSGDVQVVAVCDVDTNRREDAKKTVEKQYADKQKSGRYKGCAAYNDFRELLGRKDIDAVVIATPDHWHAIPAIEACKAGMDVYCEKPLSLTIHEAKTMRDAARKYARVFQTGSQQRSSNEFRLACELVRSGRIGKLKAVYVNVGGPSHPCDLPAEPLEPGLDWERWLGPSPERPYNSVLSPRGVHKHFPDWRNYREYSGGMMTDWGAHHFDIAQWGLGMDDSGPVEIIPPEDPKAEKGLRYVYANGVTVIHAEEYEPGKKVNGLAFVGSEGKVFVESRLSRQRSGGHYQAAVGCPRRALVQVAGPSTRLDRVYPFASPSHRRRGDRRPFGDGLSSRQPSVLEPSQTALGPSALAVHRGCRGEQMARSRAARPLETTGDLIDRRRSRFPGLVGLAVLLQVRGAPSR